MGAFRHTARYPEGPIFRNAADLELSDRQSEEMLHVSTARVALADYVLLQNDFPDLRTDRLMARNPALRGLSAIDRDDRVRAIIDEWLVANAAVMSRAQVQQAEVNTPIACDGGVAKAYRPKGYGRAVVLPIHSQPPGSGLETDEGSPSGLLDLKGVGVATGRVASHERASNGLEALACAFRDHLLQRTIDEIFSRNMPSLSTVPTYAVLDMGFDLTGKWRGAPAGIHIRRAHSRRPPDPPRHKVHRDVRLRMELVLRRYGLTSANEGSVIEIFEQNGRIVRRVGGRLIPDQTPGEIGVCLALRGKAEYFRMEQVDIQVSGELTEPPPSGQMVDFGTLHARRGFCDPLCYGTGVEEVLFPSDVRFIQRDSDLGLPIDIWEPGRIMGVCKRLANLFRLGELPPPELQWRLETPLRAAVDRWSRPVGSSR